MAWNGQFVFSHALCDFLRGMKWKHQSLRPLVKSICCVDVYKHGDTSAAVTVNQSFGAPDMAHSDI